ncbi:hypothetical protein [Hungatella hathewayi]|uniref:hypothetical protein n=1 Tax=Hungatella hathewayi TaxID=154046 RepID=UPI0035613CA9
MTLQVQSVIYKNKKESLMKAMRALQQAVTVYEKLAGSCEVSLIYGDASPDPVLSDRDIELIKEELKGKINFTYRFFDLNTGTARGHNMLGESCTTDFMMIMNPDIIVEPRCLFHLLKPFEDEKIAMTEARQTPLEHAKEYDTRTGETEWASTACTIFRNSVFREINGFDYETFFMYCDDLDFSWRIRLQGYKILYVPSAIAYHSKTLSLSGGWEPTKAEIYYSAEAAILLAYKWSNEERAEHLCNLFLKQGCLEEKKAAKEFQKRYSENRLPQKVDSDHQIARFIGDDYCAMRYHFKH